MWRITKQHKPTDLRVQLKGKEQTRTAPLRFRLGISSPVTSSRPGFTLGVRRLLFFLFHSFKEATSHTDFLQMKQNLIHFQFFSEDEDFTNAVKCKKKKTHPNKSDIFQHPDKLVRTLPASVLSKTMLSVMKTSKSV